MTMREFQSFLNHFFGEKPQKIKRERNEILSNAHHCHFFGDEKSHHDVNNPQKCEAFPINEEKTTAVRKEKASEKEDN